MFYHNVLAFSNVHCNVVCGAVYQAAQDALQNTTRAVEGSNLLRGPTSQDDISSPSADDSAVLDENPDDAGWIYTDRPPPSD